MTRIKKNDKSAKHNQIYQTSNKIKNVFRIRFDKMYKYSYKEAHHRDPVKNVQSATKLHK